MIVNQSTTMVSVCVEVALKQELRFIILIHNAPTREIVAVPILKIWQYGGPIAQ